MGDLPRSTWLTIPQDHSIGSYPENKRLAMFKSSVCVIVLCCCCMASYAEQVTLKNGDRLTGAIVSVSDKKLTLKTAYAGTITIDCDQVAQFSSDQPMVVTRTDKQVVSGPVTTK